MTISDSHAHARLPANLAQDHVHWRETETLSVTVIEATLEEGAKSVRQDTLEMAFEDAFTGQCRTVMLMEQKEFLPMVVVNVNEMLLVHVAINVHQEPST